MGIRYCNLTGRWNVYGEYGMLLAWGFITRQDAEAWLMSTQIVMGVA